MADNDTVGSPPFPPELLQAMLMATLGPQAKIPQIYFNGFSVGASLSDVGMMLMLNGDVVANVSMSFTTAKTLSQELVQTMGEFERRTKHSIMTMGEVRERQEGSNG